ncbi:MAG: HD domain-containing protein [Synergistaceae bacterium]|nr:HD domain-containing protein [Synergistaceae bacterium]
MNILTRLIQAMIEYEKGCAGRVGHFLKVYGYAKTIGELENLDEATQFILETASLVHDIGIKKSLEKHGSADGIYQEQEGPMIARPMLEALGVKASAVDRVCYLIAHHHTFSDIDGKDYQILVEADFLVNFHEQGMPAEEIQKVNSSIFRTDSGKRFLQTIYLPN